MYEDSFEYTGEDGLWSQNDEHGDNRGGETREFEQGHRGVHANARSMSLTCNEAYGCGVSGTDGSPDNTEDSTYV